MTQIDELQGRMARALDRVAAGLDGLQPAGAGPDPDVMARADEAENRATEAELRLKEVEAERNALSDKLIAAEAKVSEAEAKLSEAQEAPAAVAAPDVAAVDSAEVEKLKHALDDERMANAQLEARLEKLKASGGGDDAGLKEQVAVQRDSLAELDEALQRLRETNKSLSENSVALRTANAQGVGEPHLINSAMLAELDALKAERQSEAAEVKAVIAALEPLLAEAAGDSSGDTGGQS